MNYVLLKNLIEKLEQYEKVPNHETSLENFAIWLAEEVKEKKESQIVENQSIGHYKMSAEPIESAISRLVAFLYRYAKIYLKKAIEGSALQTIDEFGYLAGVLQAQGISKIALIESNIHEKTTGIEIIKRLMREGLISQKNGIDDKRSKQLFITEKGVQTFFGIIENMKKAGTIINGNLTAQEKETLWTLLVKLDAFHHAIFLNFREQDLDELTKLVYNEKTLN